MRRYAVRAAAKELRAGRALFALAVSGVALGVGSVLSIQLLNQGALGAFSGTVRAVSGEADLSVLGWAGALDEALLPEVLAVPGVRAAIPLWRAEAALEGRPGEGLELVGADLLAAARARWALPPGGLGDALGRPGWVAVTPRLAREMGWREGTRVEVSLGSRRAALVQIFRVAPANVIEQPDPNSPAQYRVIAGADFVPCVRPRPAGSGVTGAPTPTAKP